VQANFKLSCALGLRTQLSNPYVCHNLKIDNAENCREAKLPRYGLHVFKSLPACSTWQ